MYRKAVKEALGAVASGTAQPDFFGMRCSSECKKRRAYFLPTKGEMGSAQRLDALMLRCPRKARASKHPAPGGRVLLLSLRFHLSMRSGGWPRPSRPGKPGTSGWGGIFSLSKTPGFAAGRSQHLLRLNIW